jgi:hypothetical protein
MFMGSGLRGEPATVPANRASLTAGVIMHSHSFRTRRYRLAAAALLLLGGVSAQACEIWRDEELGVWRGNCSLKDFMVKQTFIATYQPRLIFKWPDLKIRKFKYVIFGSSVEIYADVQNIGMGNAAASPLTVDVSIGNPVTGMQQSSSVQFTVQTPAVPLNSERRTYFATINLPNRSQDWDLILLGVTDPPTAAQPVRGAIMESDETNNMLVHTCRVYGPNPDTSVAACD